MALHDVQELHLVVEFADRVAREAVGAGSGDAVLSLSPLLVLEDLVHSLEIQPPRRSPSLMARHPRCSSALNTCARRVCSTFFVNSNLNYYSPIWHRSQCCGVKMGAHALRVRLVSREEA